MASSHTRELAVPERDALVVRHLEDAAHAIEAAQRAMPNDVTSGFDGRDAAQLSEIQRSLGIMRAQTEPANPHAVMVPVGILERAGRLADEASGEACARSHGETEIALEEELHTFARQLYAAARGEEVSW